MDALERLHMYSGDTTEDEFSVEEQMDSADDASRDLLDGITDNKIQEVTLEPEPQEQSIKEQLSDTESTDYIENQVIENEVTVEDTTEEEIMEDVREVNEEVEEVVEETPTSRRGRPPKKHNSNGGSNVVYDNIIRNLIEELRKKKHTTQGLDNKTMDIIYDYMLTKF